MWYTCKFFVFHELKRSKFIKECQLGHYDVNFILVYIYFMVKDDFTFTSKKLITKLLLLLLRYISHLVEYLEIVQMRVHVRF